MFKTQILHLSDIHINTGDEFDRSVVLDPLIDRLKKDRKDNGLSPELLIVSGDIAYSGQKKEYDQAYEFLEDVRKTLKLEKNAIFIVPGNHDVDRKKYPEMQKNENSQFPYKSMKQLNSDLENKNHRKVIFRGLKKYFKFISENYPHLNGEADSLFPFATVYQTRHGKKLGLLGLNTSWLCRYSPDKGKVAIGEFQFKRALKALNEAGEFDLSVACFHHPLGWLWEEDNKKCLHYLNKLGEQTQFKPIVLSGHLHDENVFYHDGTDGAYIQMQSGSIYLSSDDKWPQRYHYITVDWASSWVHLDFRQYVTDSNKWVIAGELGDDGNISLPLGRISAPKTEKVSFHFILPSQPVHFVNRVNEIDSISDSLESKHPVVVHVEGFGGIGKSDLLLMVAHRLRNLFDKRILHIKRTDKKSFDEVINDIAGSFEGSFKIDLSISNEQKIEKTNRILQNHPLLLIFDNVTREKQKLITGLIEAFPFCYILLASRVKEHIVITNAKRVPLGELDETEIVELFEKKGGLQLFQNDKKALKAIYAKFGGIPLAMELACRYMISAQGTVEDLKTWLFAKGAKFIDDNEERIGEIFRSSYTRLKEEEREMFSLLGIFESESFPLEAIKAISGYENKNEVGFILGKLISLSMVKRDGNRYHMHPLIGFYAKEEFDKNKIAKDTAIDRMISYYRTFIGKYAGKISEYPLINMEMDNITTALDYAINLGDDRFVVDIVSDLNGYYGFLAQYGYWKKGTEFNITAGKASKRLNDGSSEALFMLNAGQFQYWLGNHKKARNHLERALKLYTSQNDIRGQIKAHHILGYIKDDENEYSKAKTHYESSLKLAESIGDESLTALGYHLIGVINYHLKEYEKARENMKNCLRINHQLLKKEEEQKNKDSMKLINAAIFRCKRRIAAVARMQAHYAESDKERNNFLKEAMDLISDALKRETSKRSVARGKRQRGMIYEEMHDLRKARIDYRESMKGFQEIGNTKGKGTVHYNLGSVDQKQNKLSKAIEHYNDSIDIAKQVNCLYGEAIAKRQLGIIKNYEGNKVEAGKYLSEAYKILDRIDSPFAIEVKQLAEDSNVTLDEVEE